MRCKRPVPLDADDTRFCFFHKKKFGFLTGRVPTKKKEAPKQQKLVISGPQVLAPVAAAGGASEPQELELPPKMDDLWGALVSKVPQSLEAAVDFKALLLDFIRCDTLRMLNGMAGGELCIACMARNSDTDS